jgi:Glucan phosphorylase
VPAGIDLFPSDKITYYLGHYAEKFGLAREQFLSLGRDNPGDLAAPFSMAILALKMASFVNGVSKLHGEVSRSMFGYRARIRNHGHSCFLCEIVIRSQFHTTYEPEA